MLSLSLRGLLRQGACCLEGKVRRLVRQPYRSRKLSHQEFAEATGAGPVRANRAIVAEDALLQHKEPWLNATGFRLRAVLATVTPEM